MLDDLKSALGQIPALEKRVNKLESKKSVEDYAECDKCGVLVSKKFAKADYRLVNKYDGLTLSTTMLYSMMTGVVSGQGESREKVSEKFYLCPHCQPKPVKKTKKTTKKVIKKKK